MILLIDLRIEKQWRGKTFLRPTAVFSSALHPSQSLMMFSHVNTCQRQKKQLFHFLDYLSLSLHILHTYSYTHTHTFSFALLVPSQKNEGFGNPRAPFAVISTPFLHIVGLISLTHFFLYFLTHFADRSPQGMIIS
jgi:hypothetical protein